MSETKILLHPNLSNFKIPCKRCYKDQKKITMLLLTDATTHIDLYDAKCPLCGFEAYNIQPDTYYYTDDIQEILKYMVAEIKRKYNQTVKDEFIFEIYKEDGDE